jgi:hypothetical protein
LRRLPRDPVPTASADDRRDRPASRGKEILMIRAISLATIVLCLAATPVRAATEGGRHSGRVVEVRDAGRSLVVEEMGPWLPPNTGLSTRTVTLAPTTAVQLVIPTGKWQADASPGYEVRRMAPDEIKPGDFVTVTIDGGGEAATALEVMRTASADAGLASPSVPSGR